MPSDQDVISIENFPRRVKTWLRAHQLDKVDSSTESLHKNRCIRRYINHMLDLLPGV